MAETAQERPQARLEHTSPGRARARVARQHRSPHGMREVQLQLQGQPGISAVEVNHQTGSILVEGDRTADLEGSLRRALTIVEAVRGHGDTDAGVTAVVDVVKTADAKVRELTNGRVSIRLLIPSLFVGAGIRQLLAEGLTLGTVPWYVLLYYGVDSFLKLYPEHAPATEMQERGGSNGAIRNTNN